MTREEAKQIISDIDKAYRNFTADEYEAFEMAIKALSQEPCVKPTTKDAIKTIQELMIACTPDSKYYRVGQMAISALLENEELSKDLDEALREIDEYEQGLEQEPCDECEVGNPCLYCKHEFSQKIEPMRDFTEEEAKAYSKALDKMYKPTGFNVFDEPCDKCVYSTKDGYCQYDDISETIPPLEPCDDAISREWLMRKATERFYTTNYFNHISAMIEEAPSVNPQKSGKWDASCTCSVCGRWRILESEKNSGKYKFCPNCGAKMEREDKE